LVALEYAIEVHAFASVRNVAMRATNGILLGRSLPLTVATENSVQTLKAATPTITNTTTYLLENASSVIVDSATTDAVSPSAVAVRSSLVQGYG
jgi:hypothetical protein